jgi:hypothetical protein
MQKIIPDYSSIPVRYLEDVSRIVGACFRMGWIVTPKEAYHAWSDYSDSMAAGWMGLPEPFDDGESPWKCTLDECDKTILEIVKFRLAVKE